MANIENANLPSTNIRVTSDGNSTPDIVVSPSPRRSMYLAAAQSGTQLKQQLQEALQEKARQIQETAELGQALLKLQTEIEQRLIEIEEQDGDELSSELRNKLEELEKEAKTLDTRQLMLATSSKIETSNNFVPSHSPSSSIGDGSSMTSSQRRRQMANRPKNNDIAFATEIGQSLLGEVRRLQTTLAEKDEKIKELEMEKSELERMIEMLTRQLRQREEAEESLKEENYLLYGEIQDLKGQVKDLGDKIDKMQKEVKKGEKALASATDLVEQLKAREAKLTSALEDLRARHEETTSNNRKLIAGMRREKASLEKINEELRQDLAKYETPKKMSNVAPGPDAADTSGQSVAFVKETVEVRDSTMKALRDAQQMNNQLKVALQKEKSEKLELQELIQAREEEIEDLRNNFEILPEPASLPKAKRPEENGLGGPDDDVEGGSDDFDDSFKSNRPSSDMFRRRPMIGGLARRSRGSKRGSSKLSSVQLSSSEMGEEDTEAEASELIVGPVYGSTGDINSNEDVLHDQEIQAEREATLGSLTKPRDSRLSDRPAGVAPEAHNSISSTVSSSESFASAVSNRDSRAARRESSIVSPSGSAALSPGTRASQRVSMPPKQFEERGVQTEGTVDISVQNKAEIATQTDEPIRDSIDLDENRFTLDLSKNSQRPRAAVVYSDAPPRPRTSPPEGLLKEAHRANSLHLAQPNGNIVQVNAVAPVVAAKQSEVARSIPMQAANPTAEASTSQAALSQKTTGPIASGDGQPSSPRHKHSQSSGSVSTASMSSSGTEHSAQPPSDVQAAAAVTHSGTDPRVIHAITQTMIGEFLFKYTRNKFGAARRHERFFWVHPYTKTLYWSTKDPGGTDAADSRVSMQIAYIAGVRQVADSNPFPSGLHDQSIIVKTRGGREIRFTARNKERHDLWFHALSHLVQPSSEARAAGSDDADPDFSNPNGALRGNVTPRELKKKSSFSQLKAFAFLGGRDRSSSSPSSLPSSSQNQVTARGVPTVALSHNPLSQQANLPDDGDDDDGDFEVENVRECCNGRHDVTNLSKKKPLHQSHYHRDVLH